MAKKTKRSSGSPKPKNPALYARVKAEAKRKFKVYPSAYANAWLVRTYKKRGGKYYWRTKVGYASGSKRIGVMSRQERSVVVVARRTKADLILLVDLEK